MTDPPFLPLQLKNSSYVYHMSYAHGISNITGSLPFPASHLDLKSSLTFRPSLQVSPSLLPSSFASSTPPTRRRTPALR